MYVVQKEDAIAKARDETLGVGTVERRTRRSRYALQSFYYPRLVALGLHPPDEPCAGIGQTLVVQVHRVLGRQNNSESVCPGLLQQCQQWLLRRRICDRREEAEYLIHIQDGSQTRGPRLRSNPADNLIQEERHKEHALLFAQMRNRDDRHTRLAGR